MFAQEWAVSQYVRFVQNVHIVQNYKNCKNFTYCAKHVVLYNFKSSRGNSRMSRVVPVQGIIPFSIQANGVQEDDRHRDGGDDAD